MNIILERNLDFKQFQNLIALTFVTGMFLLGMINSVDFKSYYRTELILFLLTTLCIFILCTKKGKIYQQKIKNSIMRFFYLDSNFEKAKSRSQILINFLSPKESFRVIMLIHTRLENCTIGSRI